MPALVMESTVYGGEIIGSVINCQIRPAEEGQQDWAARFHQNIDNKEIFYKQPDWSGHSDKINSQNLTMFE